MQYEPENTVLGMDLVDEGERELAGLEEPVVSDIRWGRWGMLLWLLLGVIAAEGSLMFHEPGAGLGVYGLCLLGILLASREWTSFSGWQVGGIVLFILSAVQSVIAASFSNVLVMGCLLLLLSGERKHGDKMPIWRSWIEGLLSGLRPLGALVRFFEVVGSRAEDKRDLSARLFYILSIVLPVAALLFLFSILLGGGNAILGNWIAESIEAIDRFLYQLELPSLERWFFWGFFGGICLMLVCPGGATRLATAITGVWPHMGANSGKLRLHQWIAALVALNLLFLLSTVTDVVFLWFSRELPEGVTHSRYLHSGVYALITTTLLSAFILGTLTQHTERVRKNRFVLGMSWLWMVQNLILISGVFLRLWIYVDAYGYTPKRIYVSLFLCLVLAGYSILGWAVAKEKDFKWLIGVNLALVFGYFSILQFVDVRRIVVNLNVPLYQASEIDYPEWQHLDQIGSHKVRYLVEIFRSPQSTDDREQAMTRLTGNLYLGKTTGWQSFQLRDHRNHVLLQDFLANSKE
ncbi:MAG: DUF4173 domain-containing protein [Puniceicoccaceae bacterium]